MILSRFLSAFGAIVVASSLLSPGPTANAQSGEQRGGEQQKPQAGDSKDGTPKKPDEYAEAARALSGAAGSPECVWVGRRVVSLLSRDDLDTAYRHLELYERWGCPGGHIQASFRCVVRQGSIDLKAPETLHARVHACWINPNLQTPTAAAPAGTQTGQAAGTNPQ